MLNGRSAVVTGSTSGIGLGIARALAEAGCNLTLNGFAPPSAIERECTQLEKEFDVRVAFNPADLANAQQVVGLIEAAARELGAVDILVNNAGIQYTARIEEFPADRWDAVIAVNLSACFHAIQAVLPQMRARNWGRLINIASTHGLVASTEKSAYVAAKHGLVGLTKAVALETAESGITCNAICSGWVLTPLVEAQIEERADRENVSFERAKMDLVAQKQPSREFVTPEQIGAAVVFLCSDAAAQIRGAALPIDGGWTSQ